MNNGPENNSAFRDDKELGKDAGQEQNLDVVSDSKTAEAVGTRLNDIDITLDEDEKPKEEVGNTSQPGTEQQNTSVKTREQLLKAAEEITFVQLGTRILNEGGKFIPDGTIQLNVGNHRVVFDEVKRKLILDPKKIDGVDQKSVGTERVIQFDKNGKADASQNALLAGILKFLDDVQAQKKIIAEREKAREEDDKTQVGEAKKKVETTTVQNTENTKPEAEKPTIPPTLIPEVKTPIATESPEPLKTNENKETTINPALKEFTDQYTDPNVFAWKKKNSVYPYGKKEVSKPLTENVQKLCNVVNKTSIEPDGKYGEITKNSVKKLQQFLNSHGANIDDDRGFGPITAKATMEYIQSLETPVKVEPAKVEPVKVEPAKVEPVKVEPAKVEPVKVEPVKVEPVKVEPVKVEPAKVEPVKVEPAKVEPAKVEPVKVEPAKVEPVKVEPVKVEPVETKEGTDPKITVVNETIVGKDDPKKKS